MRRTPQTLTTVSLPAVSLLAVALLATACGGGGSGPSRAQGSQAQGSQASGVAATPAPSDAAATAGPTTGAGVQPGVSASGAAPAGTRPPGAAPGGSPAVATGKPAQPPARPAVGAAPGKYTYDTSGTFTAGTQRPVNGSATLTLDPVRSGHQHSTLGTDQGTTEEDLLFPSDGTHLDLLSITNPAFTKTFRPSPGVLLLPDPQQVGRTWSWTTTSTDGKTTATTSNRISGTETVDVGGEKVLCAVVATVLTLSGDVTYRADTTTWYSSAHRLVVKDRQKGSGSVNGFAFSSDITSLMRSTTPA